MTLKKNEAYWTYDSEAGAYYFAPVQRSQPHYRTQREVTAILDVASDGTLAGVELVMSDMPPPPQSDDTIDPEWESDPVIVRGLSCRVGKVPFGWIITHSKVPCFCFGAETRDGVLARADQGMAFWESSEGGRPVPDGFDWAALQRLRKASS